MGLLGSTRVGSRRVIQISAGFMIFFSILGRVCFQVCFHLKLGSLLFFSPEGHFGKFELFENLLQNYTLDYNFFIGKFGALFASIPFPIFAAVYCILFGIVGKFLS